MSEAVSADLITPQLAFEAARQAFLAAASDTAHVFPAVLAHGSVSSNRFSVKSGTTSQLAGVKIGAFWPSNPERGLPRHSSTILLIDQETGRIGAVIEASKVNAFRTAAADAVAASLLARDDARTLAIFGAGQQAFYECQALAAIRPLKHIHVVARDASRAEAFIGLLTSALGIDATHSAPERACRAADIVVTATPARAPLFDANWIAPGTHVASMGSDAKGKQELPPELFRRAELFCDLPAQSVEIGDFQHVRAEILADRLSLTAIGSVIAGRAKGRSSKEAITVFDSSGIALQDLCVAQMLLDARERAHPASAAQ